MCILSQWIIAQGVLSTASKPDDSSFCPDWINAGNDHSSSTHLDHSLLINNYLCAIAKIRHVVFFPPKAQVQINLIYTNNKTF